jgi:uncharacterized protein DUF2510
VAIFGMPGGPEIWIILIVALVTFGPTLIVALVVLSAMGRTSKPAPPCVPPVWAPDPTSRHELRYWDGSLWTGHVSDGGVQTEDPV